MRFKREHEDVSVEYERQLTYADGSTKLMGVTVSTDERDGGRAFTVTGKEGEVGQNDSIVELNGDVKLVASDGFTAKTEHATYNDGEGLVRAPGPVEFARDRMSGSGVGMTYDKNTRRPLDSRTRRPPHGARSERRHVRGGGRRARRRSRAARRTSDSNAASTFSARAR